MASRSGPNRRRFEAQDPRERMGGAVVVKIHKEVGRAAGIWLRHWKRGVIEVRGVMDDYPEYEREAIESHRGWLLVGVNGKPMYNVTEVGDELKRSYTASLHLCPPNPGDIPAGKGATASSNRARGSSMARSGSRPGSVSPPRPAFKPGQRVEVYYGPEDVEGGAWYAASVMAFHYDGTYSVLFDTGEACEGVAQHCMKHVGEMQPTFSSPRGAGTFVGDRVEVYYGENEPWFPGTIMSRQQDGSYTIRFDTGDITPSVQPEFFRPLVEPSQASRGASVPMHSAPPVSQGAMYNPDEPLQVGQLAEVLWEGKTWTECIIKAYHPEFDLYDVDWRDGNETVGVMGVHVRPALRSQSLSPRY